MLKFKLFLLICCFFTHSALAANPAPISLTDLGVDNSAGQVSVGFGIVVHDMNFLQEALANGEQYEILCAGKLYLRRAGFWNTLLSEATYACQVSSKPIARECVLQDSHGARTIDFADLPVELPKVWDRLSLPMGKWDLIERNQAYRVELSFKMTRINVSGWISKPLFFVSWDLVPEMRYVFDFDY